jgi:hypothetical protein
MAELINSRRRLEKVTYTPVILPPSNEGGAALQTAAAVNALRLQRGEAESAGRVEDGQERDALQLMEQYSSTQETGARLTISGKLARHSNAALAGAVEAIRKQRERILGETFKDLESLIREYQVGQRQSSQNSEATRQVNTQLTTLENNLSRLIQSQAMMSVGQFVGVDAFVSTAAHTVVPAAPLPPPPASVAAKLPKELASVAHEAALWTDRNAADRARRFTEIPAVAIPAAMRESAVDLLMEGLVFLIEQARVTATVKGSLTSRDLQPIGLLHLEQLVITPLDIERGELVYSLPLAPDERVTLSHKEWSLKQEEYSRFVQDYFENYSERGVAEKTDIAVSSKSETEHSKTMSMSRPLAPGGVTLADSVDSQNVVNVAKEKHSQEQSRRDTKEITEKASALAIRDQKVSFTVTTVSGTEDFTARIYENKKGDKVMLIDYFRRMRKWRNQIYRTGIRMTYDVVLPDPGRRLRERWAAVKKLDAELAAEFLFPFESGRVSPLQMLSMSGAGPITYTTLGPSNDIEQMSPEDIEFTAREYGVTIDAPPKTLISREAIKSITETPPENKSAVSFELLLEVPDDYRPVKLWIGGRLATGTAEQYMLGDYWANRPTRVNADEQPISTPFDIGEKEYASKQLPVGFIVYNGAVGEARARVALAPTPDAWRKWRSAAFAAIRQGAISKFNEKRELLAQKRAAMLKELEAPDTLSLRRMEREQIMYTVLEWLFPDFGQSSQVYKSASAQAALEYGEYIKFVHDAIDWERILVLLYPYFWDRADNHAEKLFLNHADATHKEFLRAGACRVVLAIKPEYEEKLVSLLDKGELGNLAPASRFWTTIETVQAAEKEFAEKRAAATAPGEDGLPPENEVEPGELIGAWYDWTPTSALDMDVTLKDLGMAP